MWEDLQIWFPAIAIVSISFVLLLEYLTNKKREPNTKATPNNQQQTLTHCKKCRSVINNDRNTGYCYLCDPNVFD